MRQRKSHPPFVVRITKLYEAREHRKREARRLQSSLSPQRGARLSHLSLERFRTSIKYQGRPAAADIAFCFAAYANGVSEDRIERALEDDYLSRDPNPSKRAAYIRRTMEKARRWASDNISASSPSHCSFQLLSEHFKYSELGFCKPCHEERPLNRVARFQFAPSICVQRAALKTPTSYRTHALVPKIR
jgi:hypothetical protein